MSSNVGKNAVKNNLSQEAFNNLAKNNIKNNTRNYLIYFITLVFGVGILYSFNSIDKQFEYLAGNDLLQAYINFARVIIILASILMAAIFAFLINYANQFMMRKRKREFGIYITLGMNKKNIINLMFKETIIIGAVSFVVGIIFGMFLEQGLSISTAKMIGIDVNSFRFSISILALVKTAICFILVLWLINKFNQKVIEKYELINLLNDHKKNEVEECKSKMNNIKTFALSIVLILLGYFIVINNITSAIKVVCSGILITIGTYYFFLSVADFIINIIKNKKSLYYNNTNMIVISQITNKFKTINLVITTICLLLFLSLTIIPTGLGISNHIIKDMNKATPYDSTIIKYNSDGEFSSKKNDKSASESVKDELLSKNFPVDDLVKNTSEVKVYNLANVNTDTLGLTEYLKKIDINYTLDVISLNGYNDARKQQGLPEVKLSKNEYLINTSNEEIKDLYEDYMKKNNHLININGAKLSPGPNEAGGIILNTYYGISDSMEIVVSDDVVSNLIPKRIFFNCNYKESTNEYDNRFRDKFIDIKDESYNHTSKLVVCGEKTSMNIAISYIVLYLGIILFIVAGAILALHQVAESNIISERMNLLKRLGVRNEDREKILFTQTAILYGLPAIVAIIHAIFINVGIGIQIGEYEIKNIIFNLLITLISMIVIYGAYFMISYKELKRDL